MLFYLKKNFFNGLVFSNANLHSLEFGDRKKGMKGRKEGRKEKTTLITTELVAMRENMNTKDL